MNVAQKCQATGSSARDLCAWTGTETRVPASRRQIETLGEAQDAPLRILIVENDRLALDRLADLLGRIERVELVGMLSTAEEVLETIGRLCPDLLFLNVEMPGLDSFDIVGTIARLGDKGRTKVPLVCLVAAGPQFAFAAFDAGAFDFLCKPVRLPRLEKAIGRARLALERRDATVRLKLVSRVLEGLRRTRAESEQQHLWVAQRGEMVCVNVMALDWIGAEAEYVRLHAGSKSFLLRSSITAVHRKLECLGFVRIHRSTLVNTKSISSIRKSRSGVRVVLEPGFELPVGRKFRSVVQALALS